MPSRWMAVGTEPARAAPATNRPLENKALENRSLENKSNDSSPTNRLGFCLRPKKFALRVCLGGRPVVIWGTSVATPARLIGLRHLLKHRVQRGFHPSKFCISPRVYY